MIDIESNQNKKRKRDLIATYKRAPQIGLVLGAGVTAKSVPPYRELALCALQRASRKGMLKVSDNWVQSFVEQQEKLFAEDKLTVPPEEILLFVRRQLGGTAEENVEQLRILVRDMLYDSIYQDNKMPKIASITLLGGNKTLDAILTFCAARPGTVLAPDSRSPRPVSEPPKTEVNRKIGGILTTNYDNLVESLFHTKYRRRLLKPVGRPTSAEIDKKEPDKRLIPVYHIHGYIGFHREAVSAEEEEKDQEPKASDIVIAETDYFRTFYDPLGFGNYTAMSFLRRFPCLFIGASMKDKNLRRFLFHLSQDIENQDIDNKTLPWYQRKFAIIRTEGKADEEFTDLILATAYGVETIWIEGYSEIEVILRDMYTEVPGIEVEDWNYVKHNAY